MFLMFLMGTTDAQLVTISPPPQEVGREQTPRSGVSIPQIVSPFPPSEFYTQDSVGNLKVFCQRAGVGFGIRSLEQEDFPAFLLAYGPENIENTSDPRARSEEELREEFDLRLAINKNQNCWYFTVFNSNGDSNDPEEILGFLTLDIGKASPPIKKLPPGTGRCAAVLLPKVQGQGQGQNIAQGCAHWGLGFSMELNRLGKIDARFHFNQAPIRQVVTRAWEGTRAFQIAVRAGAKPWVMGGLTCCDLVFNNHEIPCTVDPEAKRIDPKTGMTQHHCYFMYSLTDSPSVTPRHTSVVSPHYVTDNDAAAQSINTPPPPGINSSRPSSGENALLIAPQLTEKTSSRLADSPPLKSTRKKASSREMRQYIEFMKEAFEAKYARRSSNNSPESSTPSEESTEAHYLPTNSSAVPTTNGRR